MVKNSQNGFSLIELLIVVTIIGIVAAIGVPSLQKGIRAADNGAAVGTLRSMASSQMAYFSQNNRFARLTEINAIHNNGFGTTTPPNAITKSRYLFEMVPLQPTDAELRDGYIITASSMVVTDGVPYVFRVDQTGEIVKITP
jgi:general secretion pathway protein G